VVTSGPDRTVVEVVRVVGAVVVTSAADVVVAAGGGRQPGTATG
jgi:hypothetical protein